MQNFYLMCLLFLCTFTSSVAFADVKVEGYYRKDGTYVQPHYRSDPNGTKSDNWTTRGNINPYTGERGTRTYDDYNNYGRRSSGGDGYRSDGGSNAGGYALPGHYRANGDFYHDDGNIYNPYIELEENDSTWVGRWREQSVSTDDTNTQTKTKEEGWEIGPLIVAFVLIAGIWVWVTQLIGRLQYYVTRNEALVEADYYSAFSMLIATCLLGWVWFSVFM